MEAACANEAGDKSLYAPGVGLLASTANYTCASASSPCEVPKTMIEYMTLQQNLDLETKLIEDIEAGTKFYGLCKSSVRLKWLWMPMDAPAGPEFERDTACPPSTVQIGEFTDCLPDGWSHNPFEDENRHPQDFLGYRGGNPYKHRLCQCPP